MMQYRSDEIAAIVDQLGDMPFQVVGAPFPFNLLWFVVDGSSNGRVNLKIVDAPK